MKKRQVQIVILCEDEAQTSFLCEYLNKKGYNSRKVRVIPSPQGTGSGKAFVEENYPPEVRAHRKYCTKNQSATCALLVMKDQDTSEADPYVDFDNKLITDGQIKRSPKEHIAILAPKYSVETWAYHLLDRVRFVEEITNYKELKYSITITKCRRAGGEFALFEPVDCPLPSLVMGCEERKRIP